jgi:hypothetical protein
VSAKCEAAHWITGSVSAKLESGQRIIARMQSAVAPAASLPRELNLHRSRCRIEPLLHLQRHFIGQGIFELDFGESGMPTAIRVSPPISESDVSRKSDSHQFVSIALFCGIGLLISLAAVLFGVQGAWF